MAFKVKKSKKSKKWRGNSTYGHGARKKWKGSGHHGGCGMSGSGKRADQKKTLVIKLYGNKYFGKQGITSRSTKKDRREQINVGDINRNYESLMKKFGKNNELILEEYKILGEGEIKVKAIIKAKAFSKSAQEKIEKAGGKISLIKEVKKTEPVKKEVSEEKAPAKVKVAVKKK